VVSTAFSNFNFLPYGTTGQVGRLHGAGRDECAAALGSQALWLGLGIGVVMLALLQVLAVPIVELMGGKGEVKDGAVLYLRIAAIGAPLFMLASAAQGFLRGVGDLRTPLLILVAAHALNVALELLFVYGFDWGLAGSAWGTVIAQAGMGAVFVACLLRPPATSRRPSRGAMRPLLRTGRDIFIRTGSLLASFTIASAVLARVGDASLAAHQIAFQLFIFLALVLDALAIAGQVMVARELGAGNADAAAESGSRLIWLSVAVGAVFGVVLLAGYDVIPHAFTGDPDVIDRAHALWPLFALMQPIGAAVFALDGILIGAEDTRFLKWSMVFAALGVYMPIALASLAFGWGVVGVWCGLNALMVARLVPLAIRFERRRWVVIGGDSDFVGAAETV
jgi:putative MATE family efflux protein